MRYIALIHDDNEPGFGVSFPDFPGCVSDGDTEEEAIRRGREALTFHIENMAEDGERIPPPSMCSKIEPSPDMAEWLEGARMVEIDIDIADEPPPVVTLANDRLVCSVGGIFGRRLARFVESSVVPDLPEGDWGGVKVVLLLESPHTDEVQAGRPLVGNSGKSVTERLGENVPAMRGVARAVGDLVADGDQRVSWLGIMNASRLPLQPSRSTYREENGADRRADIPAWSEFERCLRYIKPRRKKPRQEKPDRPVTERNEAALLLERAIVKDLQERLNGIPAGNDLLLVCCGELAQRIFERTRVRDTIRIAYAPHPARNQWTTYANEMRGVYDGIVHMCELAVDAPCPEIRPEGRATPRRAPDRDRPREAP